MKSTSSGASYTMYIHILFINIKKCFGIFPTVKMSTMSTSNWLALLVAADLQVCGVYYFRIDVSVKSSITYLLFESIDAALEIFAYVINKALVSVCSLVLRRFQYSFKQSATHNFLL